MQHIAGNGAGKALASVEAREGCRQQDKPEETGDHKVSLRLSTGTHGERKCSLSPERKDKVTGTKLSCA